MRVNPRYLFFFVLTQTLATGCLGHKSASHSSGVKAHPAATVMVQQDVPPPSPGVPGSEGRLASTKNPTAIDPVVPPEHLPEFSASLVRELGAEGLRKLEVAASVCQAAVVHDGRKLRVGCRACPPFDISTGPDAQVAVDGLGEFYELETLISGSFSEPGKSQAAAVFAGCESHAENFGGTLLVERKGDVWVHASYRSGFHPTSCKTFARPDRRDVLICTWTTDHQGIVHFMLDSYDFNAGDESHPENGWDHLLTLDDNSVSGCWDREPKGKVMTADRIVDFAVTPATSSAAGGLGVIVQFARGPISHAFVAKCSELSRNTLNEAVRPVNLAGLLKPQARTLTLVWDGRQFALDPSSTAIMRQMGVPIESPVQQAEP